MCKKGTFENPKIAAKDNMAYGVQQNTNTEARVTTFEGLWSFFVEYLRNKAYQYCYFELFLHCLYSDISNTNGA